MRILDWNMLDKAARRAALARPLPIARAEATRICLGRDRAGPAGGGCRASCASPQQFDGVRLTSLAVPRTEFDEARRALTAEQIAALKRAITNVERFHEAQVRTPMRLETEPGVRASRSSARSPPSGSTYPPARHRYPRRSSCSGSPPASLAVRSASCAPHRAPTARCIRRFWWPRELCGIDTVFKVGGAQAIAASPTAPQSIPRVDKIFGPGNAWVTAAKGLVSADPQRGRLRPARRTLGGPGTRRRTARAEFVAADLLAQAEHDPLAQAILVTDSRVTGANAYLAR